MQHPPHLLSLPTEIQQLIAAHTPYNGLRALRFAHRTFATLISTSHLATARDHLRASLAHSERHGLSFPADALRHTNAYLDLISAPSSGLSLETCTLSCYAYPTPTAYHSKRPTRVTPRTLPLGTHPHTLSTAATLHPCYSCLVLLPVSHFYTRQISNTRALGRADCAQRFCIDCAIHRGIWTVGTRIGARGSEFVVCEACLGFKAHARLSPNLGVLGGPTPVAREEFGTKLCDDCFQGKLKARKEVQDMLEISGKRVVIETGTRGVLEEARDEGTVVLGRKGRCQRCWAINHTQRAALEELEGRPLCNACWTLATAGGAGDSMFS
ncbi:uncharacterized protein HMPREF1541_05020 [Cyphellophora europaea CBS 101466]|uniref:F-box domain-containing protein n=1 Tax=Cyphellophora europaea (strain CBS 101466) TaxID=1220924 RepID=W2RWN4_CYPE1|nr:uncharacterized protein HMPREF1541_05020 [Cyphellophora europaea CBS 101466]ETN40740.1 hypothetical protein HMPREF1541_05020 [Cyphellophora europaea CBS 101466]